MKLALLLGLSVPCLRSETLTYGDDITSFDFRWSNPDLSSDELTGPATPAILTDSDMSTSEQLDNPFGNRGSWGQDTDLATSRGMEGTFAATSLNPGTGNAYWDISRAALVFATDCFDTSKTTVDFSYVDFQTGTTIISISAALTTNSSSGLYTFEADIPNGQDLSTNGAVTFSIEANSYCEGDIELVEFILEGIPVATPEPSSDPSTSPTTSAEPTMAPVRQCRGEITWGDPHFQLMAWTSERNQEPAQFNFQELGWFYYIFPCEKERATTWPFFLLAYHDRCWYRGAPKGCINNNRVVLNTKPDPWIIDFTERNVDITVGSDLVHTSSTDFGESNFKNQFIEIEYNDGGSPAQSGRLVIYYDTRERKTVVQLFDVAFHDYPRTCDKGTKQDLECGEYTCAGETIDVRNTGSWTGFDCPTCLRNIACGISGKYVRGDCTRSDVLNPNSVCYYILQKSDSTDDFVTPANSDSQFAIFANTWSKDYVDTLLANNNIAGPDFLRSHESNSNKAQPPVKELEGRIRGLDFSTDDSMFVDTWCDGSVPDKLQEINATCKANTLGRYADCCDRIGICDTLWNGCVEDLCGCTTPSDGDDDTDYMDECLDAIVHSSMNATCTYDKFFPTDAPSAAPTPTPTSIIEGLPTSAKAEDLIWLYLVFVVLFVLMAGGAFCYWKKKNKAIQTFDHQDDVEIAGTATTGAHVQS